MNQVEKVKTECNAIIEEMNRVQTLMQKGDFANVLTCFNDTIKINISLIANLNELKVNANKILLKHIQDADYIRYQGHKPPQQYR